MNRPKKKLGAFKEGLAALCRKHDVSISHEDAHGSFIITDFNPENIRWVNAAKNETDARHVDSRREGKS